jgi:hypothetical protein
MTAAILAAVFLWALITLPPRPAAAAGTVSDDVCRRTVAGAVHVHSTRSDGTGSVDAIADAASRAGLRFVVMTDHGDGTRPPDPPRYRSGVLVIDAVEISTKSGHYIALDMPMAPYPLGGEADAVVEDVARLGGFGVAAHPDSTKPELAWRDWSAPIDGLEWINLDSEWRDETRARLTRVAAHYFLRRGPAIASLLDRPVDTLKRWDGELARRPLVAIAGHDAHGGVLEGGGEGVGRILGIPSYDASFRAFSTRVILSREMTGTAADDARLVVDAIRHGRVFTAIDAVAGPAFVDYRATADGEHAAMGETIPFGRDARIEVRATVPDGGRIVLIRGGIEVKETSSDELSTTVGEPGAYRIEVRGRAAPGTPPVPWVVTNPIYLRGQASESVAGEPPYSIVREVPPNVRIEKDSTTTGTASASDGRLTLDYALGPGARANQYAALVLPMPQGGATANALAFDVRSSAPMRISAQLRFDALGGARWARSVYVSPSVARVVVPLQRMVSVGAAPQAPAFETASSILFVVDLTNAAPGQAGTVDISNLALARVLSK